MTVLKTKSEDMKMRGYDDLTQAIFNVKSAIFGKKMPNKPEGAEDTGDKGQSDDKALLKESKQLKNIAIKIHKQSLIEFKYEKARFGKLGLEKQNLFGKIFGGLFGGEVDEDGKGDSKLNAWMAKLLNKLKGKIKGLLKKLMKESWKRIKRAIKRLIGKKGIKLIRSIRKVFRRISVAFKLLRRKLFKPFRQARRFVKSLPQKAFNLTKNVVKKGATFLKKRFLKQTGKKLVKEGGKSTLKTTAKMFLKRAKLFYKSGVGKAIKKIPFGMGILIDAAINYFVFREPLGKAILQASGALLGAFLGKWLGGMVGAAAGTVVPFVGNMVGGFAGAAIGGLLGSMVGDMLGGWVYNLFAKSGAKEGAKVKKPQMVLVGEGGEDEWIVPKSKLGWWIAPLVGDIIEESVDEEQQENAKLKRETDKISEESVENVEETEEKDESKTWKPGKIFDPVIKLSKFFDKKSTNIKEMMSIISSQERIIEQLKPVDKPDSPINTPTQSPQPARTTLNNIDPDPEPDYAEVLPSFLQQPDTAIMTQESQLVPLPIPVGVDGGSSESYAVWGRKVVGN